jgi:hypothetical protein
MPAERTDVDLLAEPGLYRVLSASSTVYYLDTRNGLRSLLRARGSGSTMHSVLDDRWVVLTSVESGPTLRPPDSPGSDAPDSGESVVWRLRVGSRHRYDCWFIQRTVEHIEMLDEMPAEGERTRGASEVDFEDGPSR